MDREEKIVNKIVPIETILEVANYFEDRKEEYDRMFNEYEQRKQDMSIPNQEYKSLTINKVEYSIKFKDGREIQQQGYNWFLGMLSNLSVIEKISMYFCIEYWTRDKEQRNPILNRLRVFVWISENNIKLSVEGKNMEEEVYKTHSYLKGTIENNEDRYNKTVKNRKIRMQAFCFSIGIILSYLVYIILVANKTNLSEHIASLMDNKIVLIVGQWLLAGVLGNILGFPIMMLLYKNILPKAKYSHYSKSSHKSVYVDNIKDYISNNEVQIGKFANSRKNREIIEKTFKITSKIVLAQLLISVLLMLILK